jgi:GH35 family endo-1,4-beta-xylanase
MLRGDVTAEVPASSPDRRKWLWIKAGDDDTVLLIEFEHDAAADPDAYFAPGEVLDHVVTRYDDLDTLLRELTERGVDTNRFDVLWKTDFPL